MAEGYENYEHDIRNAVDLAMRRIGPRMIEYVLADIGNDGRVRIRMKDANHFVLTVWERDGDDWLVCDCKSSNYPRHTLTEEEVGYYSVIGARIVKAMKEVTK